MHNRYSDRAHISITLRSIGAVIVELAYGANVFQRHGQELVELNTESLELATWAFTQIWLPDLLPIGELLSLNTGILIIMPICPNIARFLPSWIPGLQFPGYIKRGKYLFDGVRNRGFDLVQKDNVSRQYMLLCGFRTLMFLYFLPVGKRNRGYLHCIPIPQLTRRSY
jgi:hypothetical protein